MLSFAGALGPPAEDDVNLASRDLADLPTPELPLPELPLPEPEPEEDDEEELQIVITGAEGFDEPREDGGEAADDADGPSVR